MRADRPERGAFVITFTAEQVAGIRKDLEILSTRKVASLAFDQRVAKTLLELLTAYEEREAAINALLDMTTETVIP